jgi:serine O-acetyltransferase
MFLLTPGFQFVLARRVQELLYHIPVVGRLLRRIAWWLTCLVFGSELAIGCKIGGGLYIPHPFGIVVGISDIAKNVTILQNVTIGHKNRSDRSEPRIEDGVFLSAGAVIVGDITIGRESVVGANSVVTCSMPPNSLAVGIPAKILARAEQHSFAEEGAVIEGNSLASSSDAKRARVPSHSEQG